MERIFVTTPAEYAAAGLEIIGIGLISVVAVYATVTGLVKLAQGVDREELVRESRLRLARGILLGLEFLVAADIIHTVAIELTFESVGTLAIIVLIRTFLSWTLEVELTGSWPWAPDREKSSGDV